MVRQTTIIKTILSLCDYSGVWSAPYREVGYNVIQIDLQHGQDIRMIEYPGHVYGILAAPPCTVFCRPSAMHWEKMGIDGLLSGLALIDACMRLITICRPKFWALENPPGRLTKYLGPPQHSFQPWEFGDPWTKQTYLWGRFNQPQKNPIEPTIFNRTERMSSSDKNKRAETPAGFARAFFEANQ